MGHKVSFVVFLESFDPRLLLDLCLDNEDLNGGPPNQSMGFIGLSKLTGHKGKFFLIILKATTIFWGTNVLTNTFLL